MIDLFNKIVEFFLFGGSDLDVLFISTACVSDYSDIKKEPNAGRMYVVKLGVKGCLEKRFHGK